MSKNPVSPVTQKSPAKLVGKFPVKEITTLYRQDFDLDVQRFFTGIDEVSLYECVDTGYRFYYPFSMAADGDFYSDLLQAKKKVLKVFYRPFRFEHEFGVQRINDNESVLDIGCGEGFFLEQLKNRTKNLHGLEMYDLALEMCKEKGIDAKKEFVEMHEKGKTEIYDVVTAFQVLEHVVDVKSFIENAVRLLKKDGRLILAVPNNNPFFQRFNKYTTLNLPPHHMGLWNEESFKRMADFFGLTITKIGYSEHLNWKLDAYYRAKNWLDIKSSLRRHTFLEKSKIILLAPIAALLSLAHYATNKVQGYNIVVEFSKR
jgi:2-polyprenyl-3-methyl-5-hydroxy-6-metoxy-1,4-benzoquinol methylase